ncbi:multidrug efflux MFS transporter [Weissella coleopterorum]|uniref:Multidrug efflux MFS transporter n=1 Tax=Weissella coleopterorum TaxID=2714949 RepID=A0A6G8B089_9LACO|nr:MFS transporter [Weissella coleopterorum]QIL50728.1 multidrug efflux MFS transporter [Weissella coleopterorum]
MKTREWHVFAAIVAAGIMCFSGVLIETSMNVTFPALMHEFQVNANGVQWVTTGYLLAIAVVVPLSAFFIRNYSAYRLFVISNLLFFTGVLTDSFAPTLTILLLGRVFQGIGTGIALPLMFHIILTKSPLEKRGTMMGIGTMTTALAPAIGPTYGGVVMAALGWRAIFWFLLPLIIISFVLGLRSIPSEIVKRTESFNLLAFIMLSVGLASLLLAIEQLSGMWLILSLITLGAFYYFNRKTTLLNLHVFKNHIFNRLLVGVLVYQAMFLALSFILPSFIQIGLHQSSTVAGLFMFPGALIGAVLGPISGRILDQIGPVKPISFGLVISTIAMFLMAITFQNEMIWLLLGFHIMTQFGSGLAVNNLMTATLSQLDQNLSADGNSVLNTLQQFTGAAATAFAARLFANGQQQNALHGAMFGSRAGVMVLFGLFVMALILFILSINTLKKQWRTN